MYKKRNGVRKFSYNLSLAEALIEITPFVVTSASTGTSVGAIGIMFSSIICTEYASATAGSQVSQPKSIHDGYQYNYEQVF